MNVVSIMAHQDDEMRCLGTEDEGVALKIILVAAGACVLVYLLIVIDTKRLARTHYMQAVHLEEQGEFKEACYLYAMATLCGRNCRREVKRVWDRHGPFHYADKLSQIQQSDSEDKGCEAAGHHLTVSIVSEVVTGDKKKANEFT